MKESLPKNIFQETVSKLTPIYGVNESESIAHIILEKTFNLNRTDLIVNRPIEFSTAHQNYSEVVNQLLNHEPIQYIYKEADFYGRLFYVDKNVLIPRQETELLIQLISNLKKWDNPKIIDIGTGSGCIACSLALEIPSSHVTAMDISKAALKIAKRNASQLGCDIFLKEINILEDDITDTEVDLIVSNPPYVTHEEKKLMNKNVLEFEPPIALFVANDNPLLFYEAIMRKAKEALKHGGVLFFEINEQFGKETLLLFEQLGYSSPQLYLDLNNKQRFASAILK